VKEGRKEERKEGRRKGRREEGRKRGKLGHKSLEFSTVIPQHSGEIGAWTPEDTETCVHPSIYF
jgi:hypothetical protein